jgi:hypothetical protein
MGALWRLAPRYQRYGESFYYGVYFWMLDIFSSFNFLLSFSFYGILLFYVLGNFLILFL